MIQYKVRPVTRFVVTRFEDEGEGKTSQRSECKGVFDNFTTAYQVGYALAKDEQQRLGLAEDSMELIFPDSEIHQESKTFFNADPPCN